MDAVAPGNRAPWTKYFTGDAAYFVEKGRAMDKNALVNDVSPMPAGYSGSIKVLNAKSHIYDLDETETIVGQEQNARYHGTDTWIRRKDRLSLDGCCATRKIQLLRFWTP